MFSATSITGGPSGTSESSLAPAIYSGKLGPGTLETTTLIGAKFAPTRSPCMPARPGTRVPAVSFRSTP